MRTSALGAAVAIYATVTFSVPLSKLARWRRFVCSCYSCLSFWLIENSNIANKINQVTHFSKLRIE